MKKLVLTVTLVVLLAAAVFGGQAIASSKSNGVTVSEEVSEILFDWGSSYRGYPLRMKTLSGTDEISGQSSVRILDESYSGVRHVSLTLSAQGLSSNDKILISIEIDLVGPVLIGHITANGLYTYEFDTDNWWLEAGDYDELPLSVHYWATITYPSNQW